MQNKQMQDKQMQDRRMDLSDHDLLIEVHVLLSNHLKHSDRLVGIALTAAIIGAVNFLFGVVVVLFKLGIIATAI